MWNVNDMLSLFCEHYGKKNLSYAMEAVEEYRVFEILVYESLANALSSMLWLIMVSPLFSIIGPLVTR